jgi:hypothetical protein
MPMSLSPGCSHRSLLGRAFYKMLFLLRAEFPSTGHPESYLGCRTLAPSTATSCPASCAR